MDSFSAAIHFIILVASALEIAVVLFSIFIENQAFLSEYK